MDDLPQWILDRTSVDPSHTLQERAVAKVFVDSDRPYLTRRRVQAELDGDPAKGTVNKRLKGLCEVDVLQVDEFEGGSIYWLVNEKSDWPIPPDVEVEPKSDELTVSEFFNEASVMTVAVGLGFIFVSSLVIWIGAYISAVGTSPFGISPAAILAIGFACIFVGWVLMAAGLILWLRNPP